MSGFIRFLTLIDPEIDRRGNEKIYWHHIWVREVKVLDVFWANRGFFLGFFWRRIFWEGGKSPPAKAGRIGGLGNAFAFGDGGVRFFAGEEFREFLRRFCPAGARAVGRGSFDKNWGPSDGDAGLHHHAAGHDDPAEAFAEQSQRIGELQADAHERQEMAHHWMGGDIQAPV